LILESPADILSFDAYGFFDRLSLYHDLLHSFFDQGRILAWGIVPTSYSEDINRETASNLVRKWEAQVSHLETLGIARTRILAQSLITPSCGTGSLSPGDAIKVLEMTREVSETLRTWA
jgi:hypothetical protein